MRAGATLDQGNTVVVVEHNVEVIKTADWVLDLGPEGGDGDGELVAQGRPEDIVVEKRSHTGQFLRELLERRPGGKREAAEWLPLPLRGEKRLAEG